MGKLSKYRVAPYPRMGTRSSTRLSKVSLPESIADQSSTSMRPTALPPLVVKTLDQLPQELLFSVFVYVEIQDLGRLAQTSPQLRDAILAFLVSSDFSKKMAKLLATPIPTSMQSVFEKAGVIMKKATCILPTPRRLKLAAEFYAMNGPVDLVSHKAIASCWGALIKIFVGGWAFHECERVFKTVCSFGSYNDISHMVNDFLAAEPGSNRENEKRLRSFYRSVFLDPHIVSLSESEECLDDDFSFYLDLILRDHSTYQQAKLIYLLFGPEEEDGVKWNLLGDSEVDDEDLYQTMGHVICSLLNVANDEKRSRSKLEVNSLIEELTSFPDNWTLYNFANLVDHCRESILIMLLSSRAINGRMQELSDIFSCLLIISFRRGSPMNRRIRLFNTIASQIKKKSDKTALIKALAESQFHQIQQHLIDAGVPSAQYEVGLSTFKLFLLEMLRMTFTSSAEA